MNRRNFLTGLAGILAAGVAPAVLPSGVLMPVRKLWIPWQDANHTIFFDGYFFVMTESSIIVSNKINDINSWDSFDIEA